ncbi:hypothetical protein H5410_027995 [Solanum commersonii]|uniref:Uncharacterized protein n=1 Tax=Solanum commersonii TaxID=4109 RepID=A0A9J5Z3P8_SOLCO|nr:hypothetical protein H5410_027995 [Solanum commersonii]
MKIKVDNKRNIKMTKEIKKKKKKIKKEHTMTEMIKEIQQSRSSFFILNHFKIILAMLLQDSRAFSSVLLKLLDDVDLLEKLLISGKVGKYFVVSSRFSGRTSLTTPSKSYVVDVVAFSNCRMLVEELVDVYACRILTTRVEVFMNVFSFFETSLHVGLPNLTTRVEVFMNAFSFFETSRRIGLPNFDDES